MIRTRMKALTILLVLFLACPMAESSALDEFCDPGWISYREEGKCYKLLKDWVKREKAQELCEDLSAQMVTVPNTETQEYIAKNVIVEKKIYWMGLRRETGTKDLFWNDLKTEKNAFTNFAAGSPMWRSQRDCFIFQTKHFDWESEDCHKPHFALCEIFDNDNECKQENGGCAHMCHSKFQRRVCSCKDGYFSSGSNDTNCEDVNECESSNGGCDHNCQNMDGSFKCSCKKGFHQKNYICNDIDECSGGLASCFAGTTCINTLGSYYCACNEGYSKEETSCVEVAEFPIALVLIALSLCLVLFVILVLTYVTWSKSLGAPPPKEKKVEEGQGDAPDAVEEEAADEAAEEAAEEAQATEAEEAQPEEA